MSIKKRTDCDKPQFQQLYHTQTKFYVFFNLSSHHLYIFYSQDQCNRLSHLTPHSHRGTVSLYISPLTFQRSTRHLHSRNNRSSPSSEKENHPAVVSHQLIVVSQTLLHPEPELPLEQNLSAWNSSVRPVTPPSRNPPSGISNLLTSLRESEQQGRKSTPSTSNLQDPTNLKLLAKSSTDP